MTLPAENDRMPSATAQKKQKIPRTQRRPAVHASKQKASDRNAPAIPLFEKLLLHALPA